MDIPVFTKGRNGYNATGIFNGKGVTVIKGSIISSYTAKKINPTVEKLRNDKTIVSQEFTLLEDVAFKSASTAATFVTGYISNGMRVWKISSGIDLGKYKEGING